MPIYPTNQPQVPTPPASTRATTPGTQPMSKKGPPMPPHPTLQPPANGPSHAFATRSNTLAKSKTRKGKHVVPPPTFSGRAKPQTEY